MHHLPALLLSCLSPAATGLAELRLEASVLQPQFHVHGADHGLPSSQVRTLLQDREGLLWVGTFGGLASFDGHQFQAWVAPDDPRPLPVEVLYEDAGDHLWIAAERRGLYRLDRTRRHWRQYSTAQAPPRQLDSDDIWALAPAADGGLWLAGYRGGLQRIGADGAVQPQPDGHALLVDSEAITALAGSAAGPGLWIGTADAGLWYWDGSAARATQCEPGATTAVFSLASDGKAAWATLADGRLLRAGQDCQGLAVAYLAATPEQTVHSVLLDAGEPVALGLRNGLAWQEPGREALAWVRSRAGGMPGALPPGAVQGVLRDREGGWWLGVFGGGLAYLPAGAEQLAVVLHDPQQGLRGRSIKGVVEAPDGALWVGSLDAGVERIAPDLGSVRVWQPPAALAPPRPGVRALLHWRDQLWLAQREALWRAPFEADGLGQVQQQPLAAVHLLAADGEQLWAAARDDALYRLAPDGSVRGRFPPGALAGSEISQLALDPDGELWVASDGGLQRYDRARDRFPHDVPTIGGDVASFCFRGNQLWRYVDATLERYDRHALRREARFAAGQGIPALDSVLLFCREDAIWLVSRHGVVAVSPWHGGSLQQLARGDGLPGIEFTAWQAPALRQGRSWIGGEGGLLGLELKLAPALQSGFPLQLRSAQVQRAEQWLELNLDAGHITLLPDDRNLRLQARATSFRLPEATHYQFVFEHEGNRERIDSASGALELVRLPAGSHQLEIAAHNPRLGTSGNLARLRIDVLPPWWATATVRVAVLSGGLALLALLALRLRLRIRRRHARQLEQQRLQFAEQAAEEKSRFLAQTSHEMKNLLGGASGVADLIALQTREPVVRQRATRLVELCGELLRLLDDLLENARLERGQVRIEAQPLDVAGALAEALQPHAARLAQKGLALHLALPPAPSWRLGDALRLKQIAGNLLSNAVKYTEQGHVGCRLDVADPRQLVLEVSDSGPGIAAEARSRLFEPFALGRNRRDSTGLGLAICRQLVELCQGSIEVSSDPGGTRFQVKLPWPQPEVAVTPARAGQPAVPLLALVGSAAARARWAALLLQRGLPAAGFDTVLALLADRRCGGTGLDLVDELPATPLAAGGARFAAVLLLDTDAETLAVARVLLEARGAHLPVRAAPADADPALLDQLLRPRSVAESCR